MFSTSRRREEADQDLVEVIGAVHGEADDAPLLHRAGLAHEPEDELLLLVLHAVDLAVLLHDLGSATARRRAPAAPRSRREPSAIHRCPARGRSKAKDIHGGGSRVKRRPSRPSYRCDSLLLCTTSTGKSTRYPPAPGCPESHESDGAIARPVPAVRSSSRMMPRPDARQEVDRLSIGGAVAMLVTLPLLVYYLWICLADNRGALIVPTTTAAWGRLLGRVPSADTHRRGHRPPGGCSFQGLLYLYAPGKLVERDAAGRRIAACVQGERLVELVAHLGRPRRPACGWDGSRPPSSPTSSGPSLTVANLVAFSLGAYLLARGGEGRVARGPGHALSPLCRRERARSPHRSLRLQSSSARAARA